MNDENHNSRSISSAACWRFDRRVPARDGFGSAGMEDRREAEPCREISPRATFSSKSRSSSVAF